ncbi:4-hydroxyphenylacetate 3-hydroxylase family protein [Paenibacillus sp. N3.4]|uniref:4-hydroxyphenylacetate 3-hydroxylase family protein n=1 Tax=Paenibacillus sp. N3.4 TaxID=2603222 RepID=UPI0011C92015|nr:4-hydroxyphenylacetate 3-hydroxylase N-terminal domain-containing protein [Paenibacillus sp. N3.4]TXK83875.1 4-hydroxyphenylacetate 3-hydroxylase [Paenibacillus sp. N3.4]
MTAGKQYVQRLNDGRRVWLNGELIKDLPNHPDFRGTVASVASLMDLQEHPDIGPNLTFQTETGVRANRAFLIPENRDDIDRRSLAFKIWSEATFGVMSRVSGAYRSQITGFYAVRDTLRQDAPGFAEKISRYYKDLRDRDLLITSAGHDPQIDRSKLSNELGDLYTAVRIVRETEEGIIVRGAKMIATGGPYMDEIIVAPVGKKTRDEQHYALMFVIPVNNPGVHLICRESFASTNEENHPLSAQYDEMDAIIVFDDALIPWERVLIKEDPEALWKLRSNPFLGAFGLHENIVRLVSKLEFVAAVGNELADSIGIKKFTHVREKLAELFFQLESIKALLLAAEQRSVLFPNGVWAPDMQPLNTAKNLGNRYYPRALEILQLLTGAGVLQAPSTIADLRGPLGDAMQLYYRGADRSAEERINLLKLTWELVGSPLGARHELYERFYAGDPARTYAGQYLEYAKQPMIEKAKARYQHI